MFAWKFATQCSCWCQLFSVRRDCYSFSSIENSNEYDKMDELEAILIVRMRMCQPTEYYFNFLVKYGSTTVVCLSFPNRSLDRIFRIENLSETQMCTRWIYYIVVSSQTNSRAYQFFGDSGSGFGDSMYALCPYASMRMFSIFSKISPNLFARIGSSLCAGWLCIIMYKSYHLRSSLSLSLVTSIRRVQQYGLCVNITTLPLLRMGPMWPL